MLCSASLSYVLLRSIISRLRSLLTPLPRAPTPHSFPPLSRPVEPVACPRPSSPSLAFPSSPSRPFARSPLPPSLLSLRSSPPSLLPSFPATSIPSVYPPPRSTVMHCKTLGGAKVAGVTARSLLDLNLFLFSIYPRILPSLFLFSDSFTCSDSASLNPLRFFVARHLFPVLLLVSAYSPCQLRQHPRLPDSARPNHSLTRPNHSRADFPQTCTRVLMTCSFPTPAAQFQPGTMRFESQRCKSNRSESK
jgi:hypothetical protein